MALKAAFPSGQGVGMWLLTFFQSYYKITREAQPKTLISSFDAASCGFWRCPLQSKLVQALSRIWLSRYSPTESPSSPAIRPPQMITDVPVELSQSFALSFRLGSLDRDMFCAQEFHVVPE